MSRPRKRSARKRSEGLKGGPFWWGKSSAVSSTRSCTSRSACRSLSSEWPTSSASAGTSSMMRRWICGSVVLTPSSIAACTPRQQRRPHNTTDRPRACAPTREAAVHPLAAARPPLQGSSHSAP
eukprot:scaffold986_cov285-Prasinococcus_capsulatus_cf.AAC.1